MPSLRRLPPSRPIPGPQAPERRSARWSLPRGLGGESLLILLAVLAGPLLPAHTAAQQQASEAARTYRDTNGPRILREFAELLAMPNVASDSAGILRNAEYIRDALEARGVDARLLTLPGANPIVSGVLRVPGATRTLGLYVHYDGQPTDPADWTHAPWEPVLYTRAMEAGGEPIPFPADGETVDPEWRIYARSSGDDKAPIGAMLPVLDAFREGGITPTSNLVFFFEGEEEAGSTNLGRYLEEYPELIRDIDVWLLFDGPVHQSGRPLLAFGVRGVTGMQVTVYGPVRGLHSGHYGNWAPVPGQMLANLLATMKDDEGDVVVEGFYDTVEPLGEVERAALAALPDYDEELKRELGLARTEGSGRSLAERLLLPALTIRGLSSGNTGALTQNVIPPTATAALGIRLVKGNDPRNMRELVEAHIRKQGYHIVREDPDMETRLRYTKIAKVTGEGGYPAARSPMDHPLLQDVVAAARRAAGGDEVVLLPGFGGSLPLYLFTDVLKKPILLVPIANHDNNQHAPNENLRVANLWYGIDFYAQLFTMPGG